MSVRLLDRGSASARPIHLVSKGRLAEAGLPDGARRWAELNGYVGEAGRLLAYPDGDGGLGGVLFGVPAERDAFSPLATGGLARLLPEGEWHFARPPGDPTLAVLGMLLGGYEFLPYRNRNARDVSLVVPEGCDRARAERLAAGVSLARDLINTPANDMGPEALEGAARTLARRHKAKLRVVAGNDLLKANFPMIHAVGRAAAQAPRLIDMSWGPRTGPRVTLVGKGVCFDTGGLDIKSSSGMLLMKKDMGGAASALGLASMIMSARLRLRLRVIIPAVENAISATAFRPGDILRSRAGLTVEIGNTDAEGRLVLADALTLAEEDEPDLLIDLATLTGAARVALGADLPPYYTDDDAFASELDFASRDQADPLWRMPLWQPYDGKLSSKVADMNNVTSDGMAGSVTAALFLKRFVRRARTWAHFDIYAWNPSERPHGPVGGEAQAIRAIEAVLARRYPS
jgi:leucyl aminopeptidase